MNETKKLYDSISDIDDRFIEEARTARIKKSPPWRAWAGLAACLCIVAAGAAAVLHPWEAGGTPVSDPDPDGVIDRGPDSGEHTAHTVPGPTPDEPDEPDEPDGRDPFSPEFNDIAASPAGEAAMISLAPGDFQAMSAEESLRYFGVSLPEGGILPGFELTGGGCFGGGYGVYSTEDRGVYYDVNSYVFTDGARSVTLTLRTVFKNIIPSPEQVKSAPEKLVFTGINGWDLALFRFKDDDGSECVYTELAQGGTVLTFTARGLENDELGSALANILPQGEATPEPRTASGTVTRKSLDHITLDCGGAPLTVWLPADTDRFSVGDSVTVTYTGEPATAHNIWPGQLASAE